MNATTGNDAPPPLKDRRKIDADHIKLLYIFHFVAAGLALVGILFLLAHAAIFLGIMADPRMWQNQRGGPPSAEFLSLFKWVYVFFGAWTGGSLVLNLVSGLFIRARRHRVFSLIVAGINCAHIPIGTVLGVFTIIVLVRDSVRELYEA